MIKRTLSNGHGSITINNDVLENLIHAISKKYVTQVGILGSKSVNRHESGKLSKTGGHKVSKEKSELTNAEIGFKHEYGIKNDKQKLPQRSFLNMPLTRSAKEIFEKKKILRTNLDAAIQGGKSIDSAWKKAHEDLGIIGEQIVQKAFEKGGPGWPKLSEATIERKKSSAVLIDTGQLRRSISSRVVKK